MSEINPEAMSELREALIGVNPIYLPNRRRADAGTASVTVSADTPLTIHEPPFDFGGLTPQPDPQQSVLDRLRAMRTEARLLTVAAIIIGAVVTLLVALYVS